MKTNPKSQIQTLKPLLLAVMVAVTHASYGADEPIVNTPGQLPPLRGPGWYSATGQNVSFYVEYGTNQGLPADSTFTGVFLEAHDMIVDNSQHALPCHAEAD
jgi:hypothetical protein